MKKQMFNLVLSTVFLGLLMFGACNSDGNTSSSENESMQSTMDSINAAANEHMASEVPSDEDYIDYSYNYVDEEMNETPTDVNKPKTEAKSDKPKTTPSKIKVKDTPVIYTVSQTDRPPLFTKDCMTAKDPQKCSNKALAEWAKSSVKYPDADLSEGSDGLEYVTFVINKEGQVTSINRVDSKKEACDGCSKAVLDAVLDMPDWQPAMLGGKPVNVVVTLPVRFKVM